VSSLLLSNTNHELQIYRMNLSLLYEATEFDALENNKCELSPEERTEVMDAKAVWHHGPGGAESPAVWKSVNKDGEVTYVTHTHRAYNTAKTLKGAINRYHKFIKSTA
jgi:hypothetical protein